MSLARHCFLGLGSGLAALIVARVAWNIASGDEAPAVPRKPAPSSSQRRSLQSTFELAPPIERAARADIQNRRDAAVDAPSSRLPAPQSEGEPESSLAEPLPPEPAPSPEPEPPPSELVQADESVRTRAPNTRPLELAPLQRWSQAGLCADPIEAAAAREGLRARFHNVSWGDTARLFIDPRLPAGADVLLVGHLEQAELSIKSDLGLEPERPEVFAYFDSQLLLAAACTNDDVVAYYDGALHVVLSHADVRDSVLHEYAHHALISAGLLGPTWAQEGIAMHVARERWWLDRSWLARVAARPLSLGAMEQAIPYTLSSEQAVLFYVQSASMVACAIKDDDFGVRGLFLALSAPPNPSGPELSYDLPEALEPAAWRRCIHALMR